MKSSSADLLYVRPLAGPSVGSPASSDEILIDRFCAGEESAFTDLVERHRDRLYSFLRFVLRLDPAEAEDLAQDTFMEAYRALPSFEKRSTFRSWLYGVARNVCRHHRRHWWTDVSRRADEAELLEIPDRSIGPLESLEEAQLQDAVRGAIGRLEPIHRAVIFLRDIETLSYEDIARVLNVPIGTVRSRLHNARVKLARDLALANTRKT